MIERVSSYRGVAMGVKRVTLSLPDQLAEDLSSISDLLGVSRSAFASEVLSEAVGRLMPVVRPLLESGAVPVSDGPPRAARGASLDALAELFRALRVELADLEHDAESQKGLFDGR